MSDKMKSENFKFLFYKLCQIRNCIGINKYKIQMSAMYNILQNIGIQINEPTFKENNDWTLALQLPGSEKMNDFCPIQNISELKEQLKEKNIMRLYDYNSDWNEYYILYKSDKSDTQLGGTRSDTSQAAPAAPAALAQKALPAPSAPSESPEQEQSAPAQAPAVGENKELSAPKEEKKEPAGESEEECDLAKMWPGGIHSESNQNPFIKRLIEDIKKFGGKEVFEGCIALDGFDKYSNNITSIYNLINDPKTNFENWASTDENGWNYWIKRTEPKEEVSSPEKGIADVPGKKTRLYYLRIKEKKLKERGKDNWANMERLAVEALYMVILYFIKQTKYAEDAGVENYRKNIIRKIEYELFKSTEEEIYAGYGDGTFRQQMKKRIFKKSLA